MHVNERKIVQSCFLGATNVDCNFYFIRLLNILKKDVTKSCELATSNLSVLLRKLTTNYFAFVRSKCKLLFHVIIVLYHVVMLT